VDSKVESAPPLGIAPEPQGCYRFDDLVIDTRVRRVTRGATDLAIAGLTFDLLVALVRAAPALVSVDVLMDNVWKGIVVSPETVTQRVKILRQALGDTADNPRYIAARRGYGYRMVSATNPKDVSAPDTVKPLPEAQLPRHLRLYLVVATVALTLAGSALWRTFDHASSDRTAGRRPGSSATMASGSVAVMPFANLTGEPAKEYFSDGMAEELIDALGQVPGLKVPARTSTFTYKGRQSDIRRIAQDLSVATVLEGSVRSAGERIRVNARLVDAQTGFEIWSQSYDRQFTDIFKLQDDLTAQIVRALRGYLKADLVAPAARLPPSQNVEAYELYLQARAAGKGTVASEQRALVLVGQAIARDPGFARALAYRAFLRSNHSLEAGNAAVLDDAAQDAARALTLSPGLAEAYEALGQIAELRGQWVKAEQVFRDALAAAPTDPWVRNLYALNVLRPAGRLRDARSQLEESYRYSPTSGFTAHELALTNSLIGNDSDMLRFAQLVQALDDRPQNWDVLLAYARAADRAGRYAEAAKRLTEALPPPLRIAGGASVGDALYAAVADPARKAAALKTLQDLLPRLQSDSIDGRTKAFFLEAFTRINALDSGYALADHFLAARPAAPGSIDWSSLWLPEMRPFRQDRRFQALVTRLGLVDYWKQYGPPDGCDLNDGVLACH
jgi:TolB-like protein/DNA-binding winged helix-turn-helix (wHTH) protein/Flp pilus assembly protein TadD